MILSWTKKLDNFYFDLLKAAATITQKPVNYLANYLADFYIIELLAVKRLGS